MIKGEYIQIKNLNERIERFIRFDFVQKEVDGERKLVQFEDELMRIRIKFETINLEDVRSTKKRQEYDEKIAKAEVERKKLQEELDEQNKLVKIRDIKPVLAQKFLGQAFHKMKERVEMEVQTAKAQQSVHNIKLHHVKTQKEQTKQKIAATQQQIAELNARIDSQYKMLRLLEEERVR